MVTELTVSCDWRECKASITVPCRHDALEAQGWKQESYSLFSMDLCPEHRRHNWFMVRGQRDGIEAPSTGRFMQ